MVMTLLLCWSLAWCGTYVRSGLFQTAGKEIKMLRTFCTSNQSVQAYFMGLFIFFFMFANLFGVHVRTCYNGVLLLFLFLVKRRLT